MHAGILGRDALDVVELPADADDDVGLVRGIAHLGVVVFVVALDLGDLHAVIRSQLVHAGLGGVVEGAVAEGAGHYQRQLDIGNSLLIPAGGGVFILFVPVGALRILGGVRLVSGGAVQLRGVDGVVGPCRLLPLAARKAAQDQNQNQQQCKKSFHSFSYLFLKNQANSLLCCIIQRFFPGGKLFFHCSILFNIPGRMFLFLSSAPEVAFCSFLWYNLFT